MAKITLAGESLIAQKMGSQQVLQIARFIYANVPGLNPTTPVDRSAGKPPAGQIVHTYTIPRENSGYVNPNQVVYSSMLGSDIGDFDFNWIGLESDEGVLFAVAYVPLQQKRKNIPPNQTGNNVTRNVLVEYNGAQALTGITIDAKTWQHDFTVRLAGIDQRARLSNRDVYGRACFIGAALQLEKVGSAYQLKPGVAYLEGIRVSRSAATAVTMPALPAKAWLDVFMQRQGNDLVPGANVAFGDAQVDYIDEVGTAHYLVPLADVAATGVISDLRSTDVADLPLVRQFATVKSVNDLVDGTTPAGKAKQLATPRKISLSGAGSGSVDFDGTKDVAISLVLGDTGAGAGTYTKVQINSKGLVIQGSALAATDIPALDWSKITSGKPTTLAGYGITNALRVGEVSSQRPMLYSAVTGGEDGTGTGGALEIREVQLVGTSNTSYAYAPRILFHWHGCAAGALGMNSTGGLAWNGQNILLANGPEITAKANKATTLAGYLIADAYTKVQTDNVVDTAVTNLRGGVSGSYDTLQKIVTELVKKANSATTLGGYGIGDAYTKAQTENVVDTAVTNLRGGVSSYFDTLLKIATELVKKANSSSTLNGYGITDAYTRSQTDSAIATALAVFLPKRSFASNDFIRIPDVVGGLIFQFGTTQISAEGTVDVTLPMTFNATLGGVASVAADSASNQGNYSAYARLVSKSTVRLTQDVSTTTGSATQYVNWLTWGY